MIPPPTLSVVICTYNRSAFLRKALDSLLRQTLPKKEYEVVVIDDGSSDDTADVVGSFSEKLPVRYFHQRNAGLASARNHGIFAALGSILFFFDDDDVATETLLEEHVKSHRKYSDDNYAVLHYTTWAPDMEVTPVMRFATEVGCFLFAYPYIRNGDVLDYRNFWGGRISCKRSFLLEHGVFNPLFKFGNEDTELGYRLSQKNLKVVYNANAVAYMARPVDFEGFCKRLVKQGRSNYVCSLIHPAAEVQEWCEASGARERWQEMAPRFDAIMASARELDKIARLRLQNGFAMDEETTRLVHQGYWQSFRACKLKGFMDAQEQSEPEKTVKAVPHAAGRKKKDLSVIAIICAYNEGDIIYNSLKHLIDNGIDVYFMDHNSTDNTVEEASKWLGKGLIHIEKFPQESGFPDELTETFALRFITKRVEQLHKELGADWYMHYDSDEFRESPWPGMRLKEAITMVDHLGYNAINFEVLNFRPTDDSFVEGSDVRDHLRYYESAEEFDMMQVKAWKNIGQTIDLATTAGHMVSFTGRQVFPVKFLTLHFPIRSQAHGMRKLLRERVNRFDKKEKAIGWHLQYNSLLETRNFIYDKSALTEYDPDRVKRKLWTDAIGRLDSKK